jgi:hypothetical protein
VHELEIALAIKSALENLSVLPAEVLSARVELLVYRQSDRLAVEVVEQIARRPPRQGPCDPHQ